MIERAALYPAHLRRLISIRSKIYEVVAEMTCQAALSKEPIPRSQLDNAKFSPFKKGEVWGSDFDCGWFKFNGEVPANCKGKRVVALINIQGEGVVYIDGKIKQGITQVLDGIDLVQSAKGKQVVDLFDPAEGGEKVEILVDGGFNGKRNKAGVQVRLARKDIAVCNDEIRAYYYDYLQLFCMALTYGQNPRLDKSRLDEILKALNKSYKIAKKSWKEAHEYLTGVISTPNDKQVTEYTAIGHAHIDLAWLWPIRETKRKGVRTFATALNNMDKYPEYKFGASQAQLFDWIKQEAPELYERVKQAVADGRMELQGGMWTENDCNIPSGESIIRQFLYGEKFFEEEFSKHCKVVWLPDVFGYPASLPQIIKKCGREYFMTIKLTWNMQNKFPYKTFVWKGIDGSEVLSHMAPQGNYNSTATPMAITKSDKGNPHDKEIRKALLIYGIGDGGGGPGEAPLELLDRQVDNKGLDKVVRRSAVELFEDLEKEYLDIIPKYEGELYLEKHQGTYTSQSDSKLYNRLMENSLHTLEWLAAVAKVKGVDFDLKDLEGIWKEVLLYQFHDIIPGSSIRRVYAESVARYKEMYAEVGSKIDELLRRLSSRGKLGVINPVGFDRKEFVKVDEKWYEAEVKAYSSATLKEIASEDSDVLSCGKDFIQNDKIKAHFAKEGYIDSLIDLASGKELCKEYLNKLTIYSDPKSYYNAWDINIDYPNMRKWRFKLESRRSYVDGASVVMESIYSFRNSALIQKVVLMKGDTLVKFDTQVDWREAHKMLRADFRPTVFGDTVNCDIQFGNVDRSTLDDTPVRKAQFEICAHKFVNVDGENCGVALLNDCKYGYRVKEGLISLNLLRSPKYPDPECDMGEHKFSYAFYPHDGVWSDSDLVSRAYCYNNSLIIKDRSFDLENLFDIKGDVVAETVKVSEDGKGIVLRVYERYGKDCSATITPKFACEEVVETDMLERNGVKPQGEEFKFGKYEIKTLLFVMK
ncbi:MAG: alpha-mannosidase [Clostridia bacterium]|nr:alpha-mannosidase [Clostridia bacterium]MDE7329233.1 alpha-mannosidase [Clostridia bacterium]